MPFPSLTAFLRGNGEEQPDQENDPSYRTSFSEQIIHNKAFYTLTDLNDRFMKYNYYFSLIIVLMYIIIGVVTYHLMMDWNTLDCMYYLTITTLTIGYGDFHPSSARQRCFTAFFLLFGVIVCGSLLGSVSSLMQEHQEKINKQRSIRQMMLLKKQTELQESRRHRKRSKSKQDSTHLNINTNDSDETIVTNNTNSENYSGDERCVALNHNYSYSLHLND